MSQPNRPGDLHHIGTNHRVYNRLVLRKASNHTMSLPILVAIVIVLIYLLNCVKILNEYERGVLFTLGRVSSGAVGPGIILVFGPFQRITRISLRQEAMEVPA